MSLNNSRGFPSILLVYVSILHTAGETKLSKNGKKNMSFFQCYPVAINQTQGAVSLAFLHKIFEQKYMRASVRAIETIIKLFDFDL